MCVMMAVTWVLLLASCKGCLVNAHASDVEVAVGWGGAAAPADSSLAPMEQVGPIQ